MEKSRIVVLPLPLESHMNPTIHLVRSIASLSCFNITIIVPAHQQEKVCKLLERNDQAVDVVTLPEGVLDLRNLKKKLGAGLMMEMLEICEASQESVEAVIKELHSVRCIIADLFLEWVQDTADKFNLPRVAFSTSSAATLAVNLCTPRLTSEGYLPIKDESEQLPDYYVPGIEKLKLKDLPRSMSSANPEQAKRISMFARTKEATYVLTNTVEELERDVIAALSGIVNLLPIGPLLPPSTGRDSLASLAEADIGCLDWLDQQAPSSVLYISFGSLAVLSKEQADEILLGLLESNQRFLWVIRSNLISSSFSRDEIIEKAKNVGLIISWAPQVQVLQHSSVGGFLTHCGWNSTLEAITSGVPLLGWPCFAEQHLNCKFIVDDWKIGMRFTGAKDGFVEHEEIKRVVVDLMVGDTGKEVRKNALIFKDFVKKAVIEGGSSYKSWLSFAKAFG